MDASEYIRSEWDVLRKSTVVKGLVAMEVGAIALFVEEVLNGHQAITLDALSHWLLVQACLVIAFLFRHAWAGIEAQLDGKLPPEVVRRIEQKVQDRAVAALAEKHPEAAATLTAAFEEKEA